MSQREEEQEEGQVQDEEDSLGAESRSSSHEEEEESDEEGDSLWTIPEREASTTLTGAWCSLTNCAMGSGILAIPFAFAKMGLLLTLVVYALVTISSWFGMYLLARVATLVFHYPREENETHDRARTYFDLMHGLMGKGMDRGFRVVVVLYTMGVLVGYLIMLRDLAPPILRWWQVPGMEWLDDDQSGWASLLGVTLFVVIPLSLIRNRVHLQYVSMGAIGSVIYFVALIAFESSVNPFQGVDRLPCWKQEHDVHLFNNVVNVIIGLPIICFSLGGHLQSVTLFTELSTYPHQASAYSRQIDAIRMWEMLRRWVVTTALSIGFLTIVYFAIGSVSYVCMSQPGEEPYGANILQHLLDVNPYDGFVETASMAIGLSLLFSYPLYCFPLRLVLDHALCSMPVVASRSSPLSRHVGETIAIALGSYFLALTVGDVKTVFVVVGTSGSVLLQFVLPALLYFQVKRHPACHEQSGFFSIMAGVVLFTGCITAIASLVNLIAFSQLE